jgi:hypothetical protein
VRGHRVLYFATAFAASALVLPTLAAADTKHYMGASCEAADPSGRDAFVVDANGGIFNHSTTSTLRVLCPAVRDAGRIASAQVGVVDASLSTRLRCTLRTINGGGFFQAQQSVTAPRGTISVQQLSFAGQSAPSAGVGSYALECFVPPRQVNPSGVVLYTITEAP